MSVADRAKHQLGRYWRVASVILVVVGVAAVGVGAYLALTPGLEEQPPREVDVQEFDTSLEHSAVVTNSTALYDEDDRLRNQPRYFYGPTPVLNISAVADVPADREVTVSHTLTLRIEGRADERAFFVRERELADDAGTVEDGRFVTNTTLDATRVLGQVEAVRDNVGTLGTVSPTLVLETTYETQSTEGDQYAGSLQTSSGLQFADRGYWIEGNLSAGATERTTVGGGLRQTEPDWLVVGALGVLGVGSILLAGLIAFRWQPRIDRSELKMRIDRAQYGEWISAGDFPTGHDRQYIYIDSLEDLVDIAIDTNKRVIYDPEIEAYAVADSDLVYYYAVDPRAVSSWLDLS